ncbi:MAG: hypothetical protein Q8918_15135 [Bacteroidota bacterium]|nr:hypothetical protein [Bacteroidota bacterium]
MADIDEMIKQEWRDLDFYYELEENNDFIDPGSGSGFIPVESAHNFLRR